MNRKDLLKYVKHQLETIERLSVMDTIAPKEIASNTLMVIRKPVDYTYVNGAAIPKRIITQSK